MKKKLASLCCVLGLLAALLPESRAADLMFFVAVNDHTLDYSAGTQPVKISGTTYVPYTVFLSEGNGGHHLGIFSSLDKDGKVLSLYSRDTPVLNMDYHTGATYDNTTRYAYSAISRNGTVYVPTWAICQFFGLAYTYAETEFGDLVRIKKEGSYYLNDRFFLSSATDKFREQRKQFDRDRLPAVTPTPSPTPTPTPTPTPVSGERGRIEVQFAFRCSPEGDPADILDALEVQGKKGLFFFPPETLGQWDDTVRRLLARGHRVGLLVNKETSALCEKQAAEGNALLAHIARTRTDFLLVEGNAGTREELARRGWACWATQVSGLSDGETRHTRLAANILARIDSRLEKKRGQARVLMDDSALCVQGLSRLLAELEGNTYAIILPAEHDL